MSLCAWRYPQQDAAVIFMNKPWRVARVSRLQGMREIFEAVAEAFGVSVDDLKSDSRLRKHCYPRFALCLLLRRKRKMSYPQIGLHVGKRDHSTIATACRRAEHLIATDLDFAAKFKRARG